ncbi:MAG: hypothetical protein CL531_03765 [Aestuariibacter sp.]|nr:hypothetical protein [Aestuariibacter sp.]
MNKNNMSKLSKSVRLALLFGTVTAATPAFAQDAENTDETEIEVSEKITVTGSRIQRTEISAAKPTINFDAEDLSVRGFTNVADILNQSPLFGTPVDPTGDQGSLTVGQNQVNLFDLGTARTLTLINGRRMVSSNSASVGGGEVDLNTIPVALIERIETTPLTGAAAYGADAIAGTVNVILKQDYEGVDFTAQYGNNDENNAQEFQFSVLGGGNFQEGRGNVVFGAEYTRTEGLRQCDIDGWCENNPALDAAQNSLVDLNGDGRPDDRNGDGVIDAGDRVSVRPRYDNSNIQLFSQYGNPFPTPAPGTPFPLDQYLPSRGFGAFPDGSFLQFTPDGNAEECARGETVNDLIRTPGGFNEAGEPICGVDFFDDVVQLRSPSSRFNTYASLRYDITDDITYRSDFMYSNSKATELANQGGFQTTFFPGTGAPIELSMDNPFLTDQAREAIRATGYTDETISVVRFNNDLVNEGLFNNENHVWRVSNIFEGYFELADRDFYWDVSVVHSKAENIREGFGIVDGRFLNAVDARIVDDTLLEQIRLQDPNNPDDDLADLDAALLALQGARGGFTANFGPGDIICGGYAELAAGTLTGFNEQATGSNLADEDLPFLDGCQPLNLFGTAGNAAAVDFVQGGTQISRSQNMQTVYTANIGGTAFDLPAGSLDFVVGIESRIEKSEFDPAAILRVPVTRSAISRPISGGFDTFEYYAEIYAPIISEDMDIPFVQRLSFEGAFRNQEFNTNAPTGFQDRTTEADVVQASLQWVVNDDISIRGTYATAFRNPSIPELFQPVSQAFISGDDPCDNRSVSQGPNPSVRRANCESIGIDTDTFVSSIQNGTISTGQTSGNPLLGPEENKSYSVGITYTPEYIEGLQVAVDYYNLEIEDAINDVTFEVLAATCFDSNNFPNEPACNTFTRDPDTNQVIFASNSPANVAVTTFEAVSLNAYYTYDLGEYGSLGFVTNTQYNITNEFQATAASEVTEDVGDFGDPDWIGTADINWTYQDWFVSHRIRWQSSVKIDALEQTLYGVPGESQTDEDGNTFLGAGSLTNETDARFIHDLSVGYTVSNSTQLQLNVLNLLDRGPDEAGRTAFAAGHYGQDERLGRRFIFRVNHRF